MACKCKQYIEESGTPTKVVILRCTRCQTEYTFYPDGTIIFEDHPVSTTHPRISTNA